MSNAFPPVTIEYKGAEYVVPSNAVWGLIGAIEEEITYVKLATLMTKGELPRYKISRAMAAALTYAGCKITPEQFTRENDMTSIVHFATALGAILGVAEAPQEIEDRSEKSEGKSSGKAPAPDKSAKRRT